MTQSFLNAWPIAASNLRLAAPLWLLAVAALPLAVWLRGRARVPVLLVPFAAAWHRASITAASNWTAGCALAGLALLIGALARPQKVQDKREVRSQGFDIVLAIDLSGSMLSEDYERNGEGINRLQAIKPVIQAFIERRQSDRIGVVLFSGRAYTLAPLTTNHEWLAKQPDRVKIGLIEDGTAIGDALGVALARLDQSKQEANGKRKGAFIVLLTDGANNMGLITPTQSAQLAKARGIPIYTIGAGKDGLVPFPVFDDTGKKIGYRSEEHTSEVQSPCNLVCRLLLEKIEAAVRHYVLADEAARELIEHTHSLMSLSSRRYGERGRDNLFFFNDTATAEIYSLSLHDALPI